jgi:outer membrane protein OmpA-like peptidoglycan-associated protein
VPFSPDNDGMDDEVTVSLSVQDASDVKDWRFEIFEAAADDASAAKQRLFMKYEGQGQPAARVTWDGKSLKGETVEAATDYPWSLTVTDSLGNVAKTSGVIPVDVLVIRDGNRLKIAVPSIVFRPDFADFVNLSKDVIDRNFKVVMRIAEILNKYRSYKVLIEGHANSIGKIYDYSAAKIQEEEQNSVIPLSKARADAIKTLLVQDGVDEKRLSTAGIGSQRPVVNFKDADNRWKNRRVEFILEK